ncbi:MAG: hypothetical protein ACREIT_04085 [Tepidisphaeraceae bacterium]
MSIRFIPTKLHGLLDYLGVISLPLLPRMMGWSDRVTHVHDAVAATTLACSVMTDYELGAARIIPMKGHLTIDALAGATFLGAAAMLDDEDDTARGAMMGLGLFCLGAALFTRTQPTPRGKPLSSTRFAVEQMTHDQQLDAEPTGDARAIGVIPPGERIELHA